MQQQQQQQQQQQPPQTTSTRSSNRRHRRRSRYPTARLVVLALAATATSVSTPRLLCEALSIPSIANKNNNNNRQKRAVTIELFDPADAETLERLRDCRRTAFDPDKQNFLNSEIDFREATNAAEGKNLCAIARASDGSIVGSADLTPKGKSSGYQNVIANVFVRPSRRGEGIGRKLLEDGIEGVLASNLPATNTDTDGPKSAKLSLDVYTQNKPAIGLYQSMSYEPSSPVHAGTLALANALGSNLVVSLSKTVPVSGDGDADGDSEQ